jgi:rubrerythrin
MMNLLDVLRAAVEIEKEGIEFYSKSAKKVKDENGKEILEFLVREEARHKAYFESILRSKGKDPKATGVLVAPRIFPEPYEPKAAGDEKLSTAILEQARDAEMRSIEFYASALKTASGELRDGVKQVLSEEKQHLEWVEYLLGEVKENHYWGNLHEHFGLDGG